MVNIPDWSQEQIRTPEQIAADKAAIETELAEWREKRELQALQAFLAVPSYVERFKAAKETGNEIHS